jgi:hypothetical protein
LGSACTYINTGANKLACEICGTLNPARMQVAEASPDLSGGKASLTPGGDPGVVAVEFDEESAGPSSIIGVYAEEPSYYVLYAQVGRMRA